MEVVFVELLFESEKASAELKVNPHPSVIPESSVVNFICAYLFRKHIFIFYTFSVFPNLWHLQIGNKPPYPFQWSNYKKSHPNYTEYDLENINQNT